MAKSRHLVDPELLSAIGEDPVPDITDGDLPRLREAWKTATPADFDPPEGSVKTDGLDIRGSNGAPLLPLRIYAPTRLLDTEVGCVVHLHGGGFIGGDAASMQLRHRAMSFQLNSVVISVNYRLAPETKFPNNLEDCYAALSWVFENATAMGIQHKKIGVMGESAGGGLAASLAILARDRGEYPIAFQHLIYPMLDDRTCIRAERSRYAGEFCWTEQNNRFGWSAILGHAPGIGGVSAYAAAARCDSFQGLPPTFLLSADLDLFLEENVSYAQCLMRAGVPVEFHVYPGAFHGFDQHPTARIARDARNASIAALARALR